MDQVTSRLGGRVLACLRIVAFLLLAPPAAMAGITVGLTIDLAWSQVDFQGGTVALLANGSFAITSVRPDLDRYQVQFFNAAGDSTRPPLFKPSLRSSEPTGFVGIGSLGSSYFLVWQDFRSPGINSPYAHAFAQLYSDKGAPLGVQFLWPSSAVPDFAEFYRFGGAPRWRFLPITYAFLPGFSSVDNPVYLESLRVAEPNAMPTGPPIQLGPPMVSIIEDAAINGSGRFVVDSFQCESNPPPTPPCVRGIQIFEDALRPITPFLTSDVTQTDAPVTAAISAPGQVLLHYYNSASQLVVRLYDANGAAASADIPVDTLGEQDEYDVRDMKGLDDGSFVLAWLALRPMETGGYGEVFLVSRFDPQLKAFEAPVVIATASYAFRNAVLKLNGDGRGVIVWESQDFGEGPPFFGQFTGHLSFISVTP